MKFNIIVAFCRGFGIGNQNQIPWHISEDLKRFQEITKNAMVIMGRETYFSIPETHRPLKDRINVVLTEHPEKYPKYTEGLIFVNDAGLMEMCVEKSDITMFIIGGETLYRKFSHVPICKLFVTYIDKEYKCDKFFTFPSNCALSTYSEIMYSEQEKCNYRFLEYTSCDVLHEEFKYLDLLGNIMTLGNQRDERTGVGTIGLFGNLLRFNISKTIPLLTTKFVPFKMIVKELLWFLKGQTNNKILQDQGVHIWDGNSTRDFLNKRGLTEYQEGDIGAMYGWQLRHFGAKYVGCDADYTNQGIDQLEQVIHLLKTDPFSRRIAMTTYNVSDLDKGVLHPCHGIFIQFYVKKKNGQSYLSCQMTQRSVDTCVGLPFNIASYAVLTYLIAQKVDMIPNELILSLGDTHVYLNHIEALKTQIQRTPYPFPILKIKNIKDKKWNDIELDDFELIGYFSHPTIKMVMNI